MPEPENPPPSPLRKGGVSPSSPLGKGGRRRIALDAGHGASRGHAFTGAHASGLVEDDLALDFATRIGHHLRLAGYETVITRPDARLVALGTRGKRAIDGHCDLFISVHINAGPAKARGAEAYVAEGDERSRRIAERLLSAIHKRGLHNRGVKWDSQSHYSKLKVLRATYRHMPAVLLEIGFVTNSGDAELLANKYWREAVACEISANIATCA